MIAAANRLVEKPYIYGGGHKPFSSRLDKGYDCSGSVSYALYGGRFLRSPLPSGALMDWGQDGPGRWITVYATAGHAYIVVAGLRFDTSHARPQRSGPAHRPALEQDAAQVERVRGAPPARLLSKRGIAAVCAVSFLTRESTTRSCPEQWP